MFSPLRNRFGIPGVISVVALVFAMVGGAYAGNGSGDSGASASAKRGSAKRGKQGGLNAKQKRQVRIIATALAKRFQGSGPAGPVGPGGPQGAPGANGNDGANGTNGTNGTNGADGKTVLNGFGAPNNTVGSNGDFYIDTDSQTIYGPKEGGVWPSPGTDLKGADGQPWAPDNELPTGATLTGFYGPPQPAPHPFEPGEEMPGLMSEGEKYLLPIGFPIPLAAAPQFVFVQNQGGAETVFGSAPGCPGVTGGVPQAESGKFCVYAGGFSGVPVSGAVVTAFGPSLGFGQAGATAAGAQLRVGCPTGGELPFCVGSGVWAVTG